VPCQNLSNSSRQVRQLALHASSPVAYLNFSMSIIGPDFFTRERVSNSPTLAEIIETGIRRNLLNVLLGKSEMIDRFLRQRCLRRTRLQHFNTL